MLSLLNAEEIVGNPSWCFLIIYSTEMSARYVQNHVFGLNIQAVSFLSASDGGGMWVLNWSSVLSALR